MDKYNGKATSTPRVTPPAFATSCAPHQTINASEAADILVSLGFGSANSAEKAAATARLKDAGVALVGAGALGNFRTSMQTLQSFGAAKGLFKLVDTRKTLGSGG